MYLQELNRAMLYLSNKENTIFIGQSVEYPGNVLFKTLENVSFDKRLEMPVAEEMQMGITIGLSLSGFVPISFYPRFDFLILAMNQLINHMDKMRILTHEKIRFNPIVRVCVGSKEPMNPGIQHCQDYTSALKSMVQNIKIVELINSEQIFDEFVKAYDADIPHVFVEYGDFYNTK